MYVEVQKGMYGLPQAGLLAQILLEERLKKHGYEQSKITPVFWKHKGRPICFTLVVDDFGVKYVGKEHARHLISVLKEHHEISEDWEGKKYVGLTFYWDYEKNGSMCPCHALIRFKDGTPRRSQDQTYQHTVSTYGARKQFAEAPDGTVLLDKENKNCAASDSHFPVLCKSSRQHILVALSTLVLEQASPENNTMKKVLLLIDYAAS